MKIETAFDNDKVFFMHENKVQKDVVKKISISIEIPQSTNRKNDDDEQVHAERAEVVDGFFDSCIINRRVEF